MAQRSTEGEQKEQAAVGEAMVAEADLPAAFRVVCQTPKERLLSITLQMDGGDPAEQVVQAMALMALGREGDALQQLKALSHHHIAAYLAGQVRESQEHLEGVQVDSFQPPEPRVGALRELARIFGVLARERLCESALRDQAYQAALRECGSNGDAGGEEAGRTGASCLEELIEEVRGACGPEMSLKALRLRSSSPHSLSAAGRAEPRSACPASLVSSASCSLPSHLEISAAPTHTHTQPASSTHTHTQQPASSTHTHTQQHTSTHTSSVSSSASSLPSHLEISTAHTHTQPTSCTHTHTQPDSSTHTHTQPDSSTHTHTQQDSSTHTHTQQHPASHTHTQPDSSSHTHIQQHPSSPTQPSLHNSTHTPNSHTAPSTPAQCSGRAGAAPSTPAQCSGRAGAAPSTPAQCSGRAGTHQLVTSVSTGVEAQRLPETSLPEFSRSVSAPESLSARKDEEEEEEEGSVFYTFVILHAPEDEAAAEELRGRLEVVTSGSGATFSQDFHVPGRHALSCVDDAINNSAFTVLLLTHHFTSRMQEVLANSALVNAIEKRHKYNTVIPLLPKSNALPAASQPLVLRTLVKLQEGRPSFALSAKKAMGPDRVAQQKRIWQREQEEARLRRRNERLAEENRRRREQIRQAEHNQRLQQESWTLYQQYLSMQRTPAPPPPFYPTPPSMRTPPPTPPPTYPSWGPPQMNPYMYWAPPPQPQPNISIQNASCVMIGNESTMTIGDPRVIQGPSDEED